METENAKQMLADVTARRDQLLNLEKSIVELHQLFQEMAMYTTQQGELIDNIEQNVLRATDAVTTGEVIGG